MRKEREEIDLRRAASTEVRAISMGKSRQEIREILAATLHARGLRLPPEPAMELEIDSIMMSRNVIGRVHLTVRGMRMLAGTWTRIAKELHRQFQGGPNRILESKPIFVDTDRTMPTIEVPLGSEAQEWPGELANIDGSETFVLLKSEGQPAHPGLVAVYVEIIA